MTPTPMLYYNPKPKLVFEIGVGMPNLCRTRPWFNDSDVQIVLFEPNPETFVALRQSFSFVNNLTMHNVALYDSDGYVEFSLDGDSSYISSVDAPTVICAPQDYVASRKKILVPQRRLCDFDTGNIDLALIDTEGCEYKIISTMISRPRWLILETHNNTYRTPFFEELNSWLSENKYTLCHKEETDSWFERL